MKDTVALVELVAVAVPMVGGSGAIAADVVTELDADEAGEVPAALVAVTVKV